MTTPRALVLLSGGLDSATCLAIARDAGFETYALSVEYGQRHAAELAAAKRVAAALGAVAHRVAHVDLGQFGGSALTDPSLEVPTGGVDGSIPITYVPARNTIMLSIAMAWAEVLGADHIYVGVNAVDYSGYPDCRPQFYTPLAKAVKEGTRSGVTGSPIKILTPLLKLSKTQIVKLGHKLNVPFGMTWSCYNGGKKPCGKCDSCKLRAEGFALAGIQDK